jgi:DhnA family fructose-bisphosphate aldolase class Ia
MIDAGRLRRWRRLVREDGRTLTLAMDHGKVFGAGPPTDPGVVAKLLAAGVDAVLTSYGLARHLAGVLADAGLILRVDGGHTGLGESSEEDVSALLYSMEEAARLGADGVAVMGYPGRTNEARSLVRLARVVEAARAQGLVVMAEIVPFGFGAADRWTAEAVARGARIGAELGADIVKTVVPVDGDFGTVAGACPVPVVALGGAKRIEADEIATLVESVVDSGGAGIAMGRNLWGADDAPALIARLATLVHPVT